MAHIDPLLERNRQFASDDLVSTSLRPARVRA
jgi:hypothetical protein